MTYYCEPMDLIGVSLAWMLLFRRAAGSQQENVYVVATSAVLSVKLGVMGTMSTELDVPSEYVS